MIKVVFDNSPVEALRSLPGILSQRSEKGRLDRGQFTTILTIQDSTH